MMTRSRSIAARPGVRALLLTVSSVVLLLGMISVYGRASLFDSDEASELAVQAVEDPAVRAAITTQIVDQIVAYDQELLVVRPVIETVVESVLSTGAAQDVIRFAVADLHRTVFLDQSDSLSVQLSEVVLATRVSLAKLDPELAERIPADVTDGLVSLQSSPEVVDGLRLAETAEVLAFVLPIVGLAGLALYGWSAGDRRRAIAITGLAGVAIGVTMLTIEVIARMVAVRQFGSGDTREVAGAVWDIALGDYLRLSLLVVFVGAVVATAATLSPTQMGPGDATAATVRLLEPPTSDRGRFVWGLGATLVGLLIVTNSSALLSAAAVVGGGALIVIGLSEAVRGIRSGARAWRRSTSDADHGGSFSRPGYRWGLAGLAAVCLVAVFLIAVARSAGQGTIASGGPPTCNGSVLLCDRAVDRVAFAATHNSMAAANDGFSGAYQTVGVIPQLDGGYRALLIDAYFGIESGLVVFTDRAPLTAQERSELVADVGEATVRSAEGLRDSLQARGGERQVYLCHSYCEVGAVPMIEEMARVKEWLDSHPREVLLVIIQDEGPTEEDMAAVFEESGLLPYLHQQPIDSPWPTLGDMVDSGKRVWVSAENSGSDGGWYHQAFTYVQDTPYSQPSTAKFSCELNRGDAGSPLFLVNHWLSPASPTAADEANSRPVLDDRIAECERVGRPFANMIAVDFSDRGEVIPFVAALNGVDNP